jgi:hypothetical protein
VCNELVEWGAPVPFTEACRRAGGRRHYNAWRKIIVEYRRVQVSRLLRRHGLAHGAQAHIARALGVHPSTISRDVSALLREWRERYVRA